MTNPNPHGMVLPNNEQILPAVAFITDECDALMLMEQNLQSPEGLGFHRYRVIHVMRGCTPHEYREDMGVTERFTAPPFRIPGGGVEWRGSSKTYWSVHTVGELRDMAGEWHSRTPSNAYDRVWRPTRSYTDGHEDVMEQRKTQNTKPGYQVFGPGTLQR